MGFEGGAALIEFNRLLKLNPAAFKLLDNVLKLSEGFFEGDVVKFGGRFSHERRVTRFGRALASAARQSTASKALYEAPRLGQLQSARLYPLMSACVGLMDAPPSIS